MENQSSFSPFSCIFMPGGTILYEAHQQLEELILDRDTYALKKDLGICLPFTEVGIPFSKVMVTYSPSSGAFSGVVPRTSMNSREEEIEYCKQHGINLPFSADSSYSRDRNLWHTSGWIR